MTVPNTNTRNGPYFANGVTTAFPFTFRALSKDDVQVLRIDSDGIETEVSSALYNVRLTNNGGSVMFAVPPVAGDALYVGLSPAFEQEISFENEGAFLPEVLTEALDRAALRSLYLRSLISRTARVPFGEEGFTLPRVASRLSSLLGFDALGRSIAVSYAALAASVFPFIFAALPISFKGDKGDPGSGGNIVGTPAGLTNLVASAGDTYFVSAPGLEGFYTYTLGDFSEHTSNAYDGFFKSMYQPTTRAPITQACWVRQPLPGNLYPCTWFGVTDIAKGGTQQQERLFFALLTIYRAHRDTAAKGSLLFKPGIYEFQDRVTARDDVNIVSEGGSARTTIRVTRNRGFLLLTGQHRDLTISGLSFVTTGADSTAVPGNISLPVIFGQNDYSQKVTFSDLVFDVPDFYGNGIFYEGLAPVAGNPRLLDIKAREVQFKATGIMNMEVIFHNGDTFGSNITVDVQGCEFANPGLRGDVDRIALSLSGSIALKRVRDCRFNRSRPLSEGVGSNAALELVSGGEIDADGLHFRGNWGSYISNSNRDPFPMTGRITNLWNDGGGTGRLYLSSTNKLLVANVNLTGSVDIFLQDTGDEISFVGLRIDSTLPSAFTGQNCRGVSLTGSFLRAAGTDAGGNPIVSFFGAESANNYVHGNVILKNSGGTAPFLSGDGLGANGVYYSAGGNLLRTLPAGA